jgi:hypothetical protein
MSGAFQSDSDFTHAPDRLSSPMLYGSNCLMLRLLIAIACVLPCLAFAQSIYKVQMPDGSIMFTDTPPPGAKVLEEREVKSTPRPSARTATPTSGAARQPLPGALGEPVPAAAPKARPIDAAMQEIDAAERALQVAKRRLELGREPLPGERLGLAGGGSRLSPEYEARVAGLEREVSDAESRLTKAHAARNAAR